MSCKGTDGFERFPGTGCCGTSCAAETTGCTASEPRIRSCFCQNNVGCLDRPDCGGFRPTGTAATGACPGPCQCTEEEAWNSNVPPKPNCEWLSNFSELRRQWSDHARQQNCKCCNCRPCRTVVKCRPCIPVTPRCSTASLSPSDCQGCSDERRLAGGANDRPDETSNDPVTSTRTATRRESGGGCPPPDCSRPTRRRSPSTDCSSTSSSWCPGLSQTPRCSTQCGSPPCQPCAPCPKSILKKRNCCQCTPGYCMCQPLPRNCNCPPPVQVDARAERECSCDCPSSPECACPPSERRFPRTRVKCPNAKMCCPLPRLPPGPKCRCTRCQPCLPPPCSPCTSSKCQTTLPRIRPCPGETCSPCNPCRPRSPDCESFKPCRLIPPCEPCCKVPQSCLGGSGSSRPSSPCRRAGARDTTARRSSTYVQTQGDGWKNGSACCSLFSYVWSIGHSILVPGPLALVSFILLILVAVGLSSGIALYRRYSDRKKTCSRYSAG